VTARARDPDRTLYLLRHAKSSWDDPALDDADRPLAPRGRRALKALARHLRDRSVHPGLVLCSSSLRTRQTLERVLPAIGDAATLEVEDRLYTFDAEQVLARLRQVPARVRSVMVIGHDPAMRDVTLALAGDGEAGALERVRAKFPTAALATLEVPVPWTRLSPGCARLVAFVRPKDLGGDR
jgi:phosphohistidine phosphatase